MRRLLAVCLLLPLGFALAPLTPPLRAQPAAAPGQAVIDEVYAAMFAALEAGVFARARNLCDQVILWEPGNPVHHYNLACIEARAGTARLEFALAALTRAVELGFVDATHVRGDSDLVNLHRDPRFTALLARMDAARAALPPAAPRAPASAVLTATAALPRGLFLAAPAGAPAGTLVPERSIWVFADDGTVLLDPVRGLPTDGSEAPAAARRAVATLHGDVMSLAWTDGSRLASKLTPAAGGFTWQGWHFVPAAPAPTPAQLAGRYTRGSAFSLGANAPDAPAELTLAADGRATWRTADGRAQAGRWQLAAHTLALTRASASAPSPAVPAGRFLCFTFRRDAAPDAPPQLYVGGFVFERQP